MPCDIGVVGLGVMGANLALNMERNGFHIAGYDLEAAKGQAFVAGPAAGRHVELAPSPDALMAMLKRPRRVLMMVPAGAAVDSAIAHLKPHLQPGDILIDGGNSWFLDTERRSKELAGGGFHFIGTGVSGGEQGALWGPAIMPGGQREAWDALAPILRAIAAKADDGEPCVEYMGPGGAGHYVKMVHNGIEYGDMQLIAEAYDLLSRGLRLPAKELSAIFEEWNTGDLRSYLIEITAEVLARTDPETGRPLVDLILDEAQQKGTGKWTSQHAFDIGAPIPTINAAVESRILSALKTERVHASRILHGPAPQYHGKKERLVDAVRAALYASKVTSYAQGFGLLKLASAEYKYDLRAGDIARIWRAGCIIRASLLGDIMAAYQRDAALPNLLLDDAFRQAVESRQGSWRFVVQVAVETGIPVPAMSASLAYFDAYRSERLPANLTQGQRDYFGAHTYRRVDKPGVFHTEW
ncbi:MAG: NADP-dependent phosphogluconate dehydrogenase [Vicinamibacterales bacterium]|jgi:6-phosphogluconate dehydrogenase|nr:NADP-dependent phosphogluconate dehydrogenase [Vicinamibacterales bacterium]